MVPILVTIAGLLAQHGSSILSAIIGKATSIGIEKATAYLEKKAGIPLVDANGNTAQLKDKEIEHLKQVIEDNKVELTRLLVEEHKLSIEEDKTHLADTRDARYLQEMTNKEYAKLVENAGEDAASGLWLSVNFIYIFAGTIALAIFIVLVVVVIFADKMSTTQSNLTFLIVGSLSGWLGTILTYFYGSAIGQGSPPPKK